MTNLTFSKQHIQHYVAFDKVRAGGRWNMLSPAAQRATKLNDEDYMFVMDNYDKLQQQHYKEKGTTPS